MILTGKEILREVQNNNIILNPLDIANIKRDSYNYRLGHILKCASHNEMGELTFSEVDLSTYDYYVLQPNTLYLGHTFEEIGSSKYAMSLIGKSSMGRLGLFLQISANLGHTNSSHSWTLELYSPNKIVLRNKMVIGQVTFWNNEGDNFLTNHFYNHFNTPTESIVKPNIGGKL